MAIETLYKGESRTRTIRLKDSEGTAIPHGNINDVRVLLFVNTTVVARYAKVLPEDDGQGYIELTEEDDDGEYSLSFDGDTTAEWPKGTLHMEVYISLESDTIDTGLRRIARQELYNIRESMIIADAPTEEA
jgi:hypothetical protein